MGRGLCDESSSRGPCLQVTFGNEAFICQQHGHPRDGKLFSHHSARRHARSGLQPVRHDQLAQLVEKLLLQLLVTHQSKWNQHDRTAMRATFATKVVGIPGGSLPSLAKPNYHWYIIG